MPLILSSFLSILVLALVFALLYWIVMLIASILPPPVKAPATTLMLVFLAILAVCGLLDMTGLLGVRHLVWTR